MDLKPKTCRMCGETKDRTEFYMRPEGGRRGYCRACRSVTQLEWRLRKKYEHGVISRADTLKLQEIHKIYDDLRERGLHPPNTNRRAIVIDVQVEHLKRRVEELPTRAPEIVGDVGTLERWLEVPLDRHPDYYEQVSYKLLDKYRPMIGVDDDGNAVYDDSKLELLRRVDDRFDEYEKQYWETHDE